MRSIDYFKRHAPMLGLFAAVLSAGCAVVEPKAERWVPPAVGSTWDIAQRNTGSYGKNVQFRVTRGDGTWQGMPVLTLSNSLGMTTMVSPESGRWHAIVGRDGKALMSWDPPLGWDYPLTVGKTWTTSHKMTVHATGKTLSYDLACKVDNHGDVTVAAGTFKAFKVVCSTTAGNEETYWTSPELGVFVKTSLKRTDKSPFGPGTQEAELVAQTIKR